LEDHVRRPNVKRPIKLFSLDTADLPAWRKFVAVGIVIATFLFVVVSPWHASDIDIYYLATKNPSVQTGEIVPVRVMHGSTRYVTAEKAKDFEQGKHEQAKYGPLPLFAIFLTLAMFRRD
jgi:hypothetical protein